VLAKFVFPFSGYWFIHFFREINVIIEVRFVVLYLPVQA